MRSIQTDDLEIYVNNKPKLAWKTLLFRLNFTSSDRKNKNMLIIPLQTLLNGPQSTDIEKDKKKTFSDVNASKYF